eukprot:m.234860 g.234860  ORF g.234860 m.234860 type:complete len:97 (+) comp40122_c0_seq1:614-904(+)
MVISRSAVGRFHCMCVLVTTLSSQNEGKKHHRARPGKLVQTPGSAGHFNCSLYSGCGVNLMYCFPEGTGTTSTPLGNSLGVSSCFTDGSTMQRSPC